MHTFMSPEVSFSFVSSSYIMQIEVAYSPVPWSEFFYCVKLIYNGNKSCILSRSLKWVFLLHQAHIWLKYKSHTFASPEMSFSIGSSSYIIEIEVAYNRVHWSEFFYCVKLIYYWNRSCILSFPLKWVFLLHQAHI